MKKLLLLLALISFIHCKNDKKTVETEGETTEDVSITEDQDNILKYNPEATALKWTAYKTPEKVAVHGSFDSIILRNSKESVIPEEILEGADFTIYTPSMATGDESRDAKVIGLYFNNLASKEITGSFGKFEDNIVPVTIKMNDQEVVKNFQYTFENKKIIITGVVDMIEDFKSNSAFDLIHEACYQLHQGKTWTDVSIEIITHF